nr:mediator of RNA polymerase II transcription subunit 14 [Tanacetum cinerariifolium]
MVYPIPCLPILHWFVALVLLVDIDAVQVVIFPQETLTVFVKHQDQEEGFVLYGSREVMKIMYCRINNQQLASTLSSHETCFTQAVDSMFFIHEGLQQARAPIYDVPSVIEILLTGTYERLPKCTEDVGRLLLTLRLQLCILSCMSCVPLIMDTIIRQVQALRIGRWKDAIRFEIMLRYKDDVGSFLRQYLGCLDIGLCSILRVPDFWNSHIPMWFPLCWHQVYYQVVSSEFSSASRVFGYGIMQDFFDACHENEDVHEFLRQGGQAWFYKGFDQLVIGLAWTFSLSAIFSWFVVPCSALLLLIAPFLDMGWLMDSYLLIQEGFAFEIKTWTTFFDISWSIGADISMIVDLAVWTEIRNRCNDFEYMVLLEDI